MKLLENLDNKLGIINKWIDRAVFFTYMIMFLMFINNWGDINFEQVAVLGIFLCVIKLRSLKQ